MKEEFILERIEHEDIAGLLQCLTGWEAVIFVLEDEPPADGSPST